MKKILFSSVVVGAVAVAAFAAVKSGLDKGENVSPFHPTHVSGPLANSDSCFPCTYKNRPQIQVWVNGDSQENVMAISKSLASAMETHKKAEFKAMVVMLVDPAKMDATKKSMEKAMAAYKGNPVAISLLATNDDAVSAYKFNMKAKNTVFAYKNWKVADKMVDFKADKAGIEALNGVIAKLTK
jgi:hypothetical protein